MPRHNGSRGEYHQPGRKAGNKRRSGRSRKSAGTTSKYKAKKG